MSEPSWHYILRGDHQWNFKPEGLEAVARGLGVSIAKVRELARQSRDYPPPKFHLAARSGRLNESNRKVVQKIADVLLEQQDRLDRAERALDVIYGLCQLPDEQADTAFELVRTLAQDDLTDEEHEVALEVGELLTDDEAPALPSLDKLRHGSVREQLRQRTAQQARRRGA